MPKRTRNFTKLFFEGYLIKERKGKLARNISRNTTVVVPAHKIPAFKPAEVFKAEVAK